MKPEDQKTADASAQIIEEAIERMRAENIPAHIIVDRLATYGAFIAVQAFGKSHTAEQFRRTADAIEGGIFDGVGKKPAGRG